MERKINSLTFRTFRTIGVNREKPWKSYERAKKEGGLDKQTQQVRGNETNASFIITSSSRAKVLSSSDFVYIVGCKREKGFSNFHIEIIKK